mmetsp:Transcript_37462/g.95073  ORF Transcript_37462/g.95073 Transcript_37462/m.95073 type:complete len:248 (-) Transcript_37462:32-775(-)
MYSCAACACSSPSNSRSMTLARSPPGVPRYALRTRTAQHARGWYAGVSASVAAEARQCARREVVHERALERHRARAQRRGEQVHALPEQLRHESGRERRGQRRPAKHRVEHPATVERERLEVLLRVGARDAVEDQVDALRCQRTHRREPRALVPDGAARRAESPRECELLRRAHRHDHVEAGCSRQLDGSDADARGGGVDQHGLPRRRAAELQVERRGQPRLGHRGRLYRVRIRVRVRVRVGARVQG